MADPIARLRELEAGATEGPWRIDGRRVDALKEKTVAEVPPWGVYSGRVDDRNRNFIVSLRNALPALLDYVEAMEGWPDLFGDSALAAKRRVTDARAALSRALGMEDS